MAVNHRGAFAASATLCRRPAEVWWDQVEQ